MTIIWGVNGMFEILFTSIINNVEKKIPIKRNGYVQLAIKTQSSNFSALNFVSLNLQVLVCNFNGLICLA